MEIFIDLAKIADGQPEPNLPGIDLNLSGLVDFKKPELILGIDQSPLRSETELVSPGFNPVEYFDQIQSELFKIKAAQESPSINDDRGTLREVQTNVSVALDPIAAYLETRLDKIESITNKTDEIRQLIEGKSDTLFSEVQQIVNTPLNQVAAIEKESSIGAITDMVAMLMNNLSGPTQTEPSQPQSGVISNLLTNNQETTIDRTSQNISNLSDTVSNFATNILNGGTPAISNLAAESGLLPEPKKELLSITKELVKPDFGAASLSALQQIAESGQTLTAASANISNSSTSQYNNTTIESTPTAPLMQQPMEQSAGNAMIVSGGSKDSGAVYLMQMLNLMKSGQLKVKIS